MFSFITTFAITLPETAIADILESVKGIFGDLAPIFWLIIGVYVAFMIIAPLIKLFLYWGSRKVFGGRYRLYKTTDEDDQGNEIEDTFYDDENDDEF